jgi:putative transposase
MPKYTKILEANIKNLRNSMTELSLDQFLVSTIDALMEMERGEYLEQAKTQNKEEKGNGFYGRAFNSLNKNCLRIHVPRSRSGDFSPNTLDLVKMSQEQVNELCLSLYKKGMTSRDIADLMKEMFGEGVSATKVSKLSQIFRKFREAWENSLLEKRYLAMFCDCLFITVRRGDSYSKEAVYIAYGVREDLKREILCLSINPTESAEEWGELFEKLRVRGVEEISLIVADGLQGLEEEVHRIFPKAKFQKCVVHKMRNILNKTRPKDKEALSRDLKEVFDNFEESATLQEAKEKVESFCAKWEKTYPKIRRFFDEKTIDYLFTYIQFPPRVRRMIYTTNSLENVNRIIRKGTKNKLSFESPETLLDYVFMIVKDFEERNFMKFAVSEFRYFD